MAGLVLAGMAGAGGHTAAIANLCPYSHCCLSNCLQLVATLLDARLGAPYLCILYILYTPLNVNGPLFLCSMLVRVSVQ